MKRILIVLLFIAAGTTIITSCGGDKKDKNTELANKKAELEKLKTELKTTSDKIAKVEDDILKLDSNANDGKAKLVAVATIGSDTFNHFIDLQGKVDAENVAYVAPRGAGGVVKAIYVKAGSHVSKGQLVMKLDDAITRQNVVAAQQQIGGIKAQLDQAQSIYERQQNLWKQNIGTEVQVLNAKTNVEALRSQLKGAEANVALAQEQSNLSNVYAEISGVVDEVNIKVGEFFSPQSAASPGAGIKIVNSNDLKVMVNVPENYLGKVTEGTVLRVTFPDANGKVLTTKVSVAGKLIDATTRSFNVEGKLPNDKDLHPNQVAMVQIQDYKKSDAITIPVNTLQNDEKGKYVMIAAIENGKKFARKRNITIGQLYGAELEVTSGLKAGDLIITDGFQNLYEGQLITTEVQ